jgi:hypothetical protein
MKEIIIKIKIDEDNDQILFKVAKNHPDTNIGLNTLNGILQMIIEENKIKVGQVKQRRKMEGYE